MNKTLVAYFSASGVTKALAERLAKIKGAELFEIEPVNPYSEADLDWTNSKSRSTIEMKDKSSRPAVKSKVENMGDYGVIYLGFPIWWYVAPTIVNTFLEGYNLEGKTIIPFATSGGSGMGRTNDYLAPSCKGATLKPGKRLSASVSDGELAKL